VTALELDGEVDAIARLVYLLMVAFVCMRRAPRIVCRVCSGWGRVLFKVSSKACDDLGPLRTDRLASLRKGLESIMGDYCMNCRN
jgi:hypothetical protein